MGHQNNLSQKGFNFAATYHVQAKVFIFILQDTNFLRHIRSNNLLFAIDVVVD